MTLREQQLETALRRLIDSTEGQEVCFSCGERLTMDSPQQGHTPECDYEPLLALADPAPPEEPHISGYVHGGRGPVQQLDADKKPK